MKYAFFGRYHTFQSKFLITKLAYRCCIGKKIELVNHSLTADS